MTQKLRWHSLHVKTLIKNIFIEFMNKLQEHLKIHDEGSMRCLARWEVLKTFHMFPKIK